MKVLGIDPGISATGYGILSIRTAENRSGETTGPDITVIDCGTIRPKKAEVYCKISEICKNIEGLINTDKPDLAVLEKVFYKKNIQSLLRSSELRGAIILTLINSNITIVEYTPAQIKLTTTGNGRASKQQVRYFIEKILTDINKRISNDAIDALAIAYTGACKLQSQKNLIKTRMY